MKSFVRVLSVLIAAMILFSLVACGNGNSKGSSSSQTTVQTSNNNVSQTNGTTQAAKEPVKLSYMLAQSHNKDYISNMLDKFKSDTSYITVERQVIPDNQFVNLVQVKFSSGEACDIIEVNNGTNLKNFRFENFLTFEGTEPWTSRINNVDAAKHQGKIMGVNPGESIGLGLIYNKDIFTKYSLNIPKTYEELLGVCETLKKNNIIPIYASDKDTWTIQIWLTALAPVFVKDIPDFWSKIYSNQQKFADTPQFEEILTKQLELLQKGYFNKDHMSATYDMANRAIAEGKAAMYLNGGWAVPEMQKINPKVNVGITAIPFGNPDIISGGNLTEVQDPVLGAPDVSIAVSAKTTHPNESKEFINYLTQPEWVTAYCKAWGTLPNFKDVQMEMEPYQQEYYDQYFKTGNAIPEMNSRIPVDPSELWNYEQEMLAGGKTPKQVLQAWDAKFVELCKAKGIAGF
jgi:ABC-type sugar transport system, periplasmic component